MPVKVDGSVDWSKFFMGAAVAFVFVMQAYHSMRLDDLRTDTKKDYMQNSDIRNLIREEIERSKQEDEYIHRTSISTPVK